MDSVKLVGKRFFLDIVVESAKHADSRGRETLQDKPQNNVTANSSSPGGMSRN